jgi:hypothetical protein
MDKGVEKDLRIQGIGNIGGEFGQARRLAKSRGEGCGRTMLKTLSSKQYAGGARQLRLLLRQIRHERIKGLLFGEQVLSHETVSFIL